jgi:hypothetical protein
MVIKEYNERCIAGRCLTERNKNNLCCPEYGLTVVCSSFVEDSRFTLAGNSFKERSNANINMKLSNKNYWKNRASNEYKYLVDKIYNEKEISLSEINNLFKSMGFEYIYIFDPSCRYCEIDPLEAEKYRNIELIKPSERTNNKQQEIFTSQPITSIIPGTNSNINKLYIPSSFNDCYNGVCNMFSKSKVDGGRKRQTKKVFKKRKTKKVFKKRKTKKVFKKRKTKKIHF